MHADLDSADADKENMKGTRENYGLDPAAQDGAFAMAGVAEAKLFGPYGSAISLTHSQIAKVWLSRRREQGARCNFQFNMVVMLADQDDINKVHPADEIRDEGCRRLAVELDW